MQKLAPALIACSFIWAFTLLAFADKATTANTIILTVFSLVGISVVLPSNPKPDPKQ